MSVDLTKSQIKTQEYNAKYYKANKSNIMQKLMLKKECTVCGKMIAHQNMNKHKTRPSCARRAAKTEDTPTVRDELAKMKAEMDELRKQLVDQSEDSEVEYEKLDSE